MRMPLRVEILVAVVLAMVSTARPAAAQREAPVPGPRPGVPSKEPVERPRPAVPGAPALKAEQLTKDQFDRLPDSQVIDIKGQRITAGELRARARRAAAEAEAKAKAAAGQAQADFAAYRTKFLTAEKAKLDAENAKIEAMAARLRQQRGSPVQPSQSSPRVPRPPGVPEQ